ncbi:hypothetical protein YC2023_052127 [Brassica napus]
MVENQEEAKVVKVSAIQEQLGSCLTFSGHSLKDDCTENEVWFRYIKTTLGRGVPFQILLEDFYGKKLHGCMVLMVLEQVTDIDTLVPQHTPFKGFKFQHVKNVDWLITVFVLSWLLTTSKKGKAEIIQRDSTGSKPEKLHRASKHRMCVPLPSGGILTPNGLQSLGLSGLGSNTGFERLHYR